MRAGVDGHASGHRRQARGGDLDDALRGEAGARHVEPSPLIVDELADSRGFQSDADSALSISLDAVP